VGENSLSWRQADVDHGNSNGDENRQADGRMKPKTMRTCQMTVSI
jgi:hypothetical protein